MRNTMEGEGEGEGEISKGQEVPHKGKTEEQKERGRTCATHL